MARPSNAGYHFSARPRRPLLHAQAEQGTAPTDFSCAVCARTRDARAICWLTPLGAGAPVLQPVCNPCHALALSQTGPTPGPPPGADAAPGEPGG